MRSCHVVILGSEKALLLLTASFSGEALLRPTGGYALCGRETLLLGDGTMEGLLRLQIFPSSLASMT